MRGGVEEVEFSGTLLENGEVLCHCSEQSSHRLLPTRKSQAKHHSLYHTHVSLEAFQAGMDTWLSEKAPCSPFVPKSVAQRAKAEVAVVEAYRCPLSLEKSIKSCCFVALTEEALVRHARRFHYWFLPLDMEEQKVRAQVSYTVPGMRMKPVLVWVRGIGGVPVHKRDAKAKKANANAPAASAVVRSTSLEEEVKEVEDKVRDAASHGSGEESGSNSESSDSDGTRLSFSGVVTGNGEIICTVAPCTLEAHRVFSYTTYSLGKHFTTYHKRTAARLRVAFVKWVTPRMPLPVGLKRSSKCQKPMANVKIHVGWKCPLPAVSKEEGGTCTFISRNMVGLRTHAEKVHLLSSLAVKGKETPVAAQFTRNTPPGVRTRQLVWVDAPLPANMNELIKEEEEETEEVPKVNRGSDGRFASVKPKKRKPKRKRGTDEVAEIEEFEGLVTGNGGVICLTLPCTAEDPRTFRDSYSSIAAHCKRFHPGIAVNSFLHSVKAFIQPQLPLPIGLSRETYPQDAMEHVPIEIGMKCCTVDECAFVSASLHGIVGHARRAHGVLLSLGETKKQPVYAQATHNIQPRGKGLVWVKPPKDAPPIPSVPAAEPQVAETKKAQPGASLFKGRLLGNGELVCATPPCRPERYHCFRESFGQQREHFNRYHSKAGPFFSAEHFMEQVSLFTEPLRPLPRGVPLKNYIQEPAPDALVIPASLCPVSGCGKVFSTIAGVLKHARRVHSFRGDVGECKPAWGQYTWKTTRGRKEIAWVHRRGLPVAPDSSSEEEEEEEEEVAKEDTGGVGTRDSQALAKSSRKGKGKGKGKAAASSSKSMRSRSKSKRSQQSNKVERSVSKSWSKRDRGSTALLAAAASRKRPRAWKERIELNLEHLVPSAAFSISKSGHGLPFESSVGLVAPGWRLTGEAAEQVAVATGALGQAGAWRALASTFLQQAMDSLVKVSEIVVLDLSVFVGQLHRVQVADGLAEPHVAVCSRLCSFISYCQKERKGDQAVLADCADLDLEKAATPEAVDGLRSLLITIIEGVARGADGYRHELMGGHNLLLEFVQYCAVADSSVGAEPSTRVSEAVVKTLCVQLAYLVALVIAFDASVKGSATLAAHLRTPLDHLKQLGSDSALPSAVVHESLVEEETRNFDADIDVCDRSSRLWISHNEAQPAFVDPVQIIEPTLRTDGIMVWSPFHGSSAAGEVAPPRKRPKTSHF